jgi:L-amino acid N-acyltransferase YncA
MIARGRHGLPPLPLWVRPAQLYHRSVRIRLAELADAEAIRAIYNVEVLGSTNTFDMVPRTKAEQEAWILEHSGVHPAIVAVEDSSTDEPGDGGTGADGSGAGGTRAGGLRLIRGGSGGPESDPGSESGGQIGANGEIVLGFGSLSSFRERSGYSATAENSVYVDRAQRGKGVGQALLAELLVLASAHGFHSLIARIAGHNETSIGLHRAAGFELVGVEREVGRKHRQWLDVVELQRLL